MLAKLPSRSRTQFLSRIDKNREAILQDDCITWANLISENGKISDSGLEQASQLFRSGSKPDAYTLAHLIRACTNSALISTGERLHSHVLKSGFRSDVFVFTALINLYVKFEFLQDAHKLFDEMPEPSVVSWNSLISGYIRSGQFRRALQLFVQLENSDLSADSYSFTAALSACGQLSTVQMGRSVHSKIVKHGVECSTFVANCLIDMYGKCGYVDEAMNVFQSIVEKDIISWNSVLAANARNAKLEQALDIFRQIPHPDTISHNELIHGIAQFGLMEDAIALLSEMPNPNSSSWNSIVTGYVNRGRGREAMEFFSKMHTSGVRMDEFTFSSILSGIASLSIIVWGSLAHCCTLKSGLDGYVVVGSALIDMYCKCGHMEEAERLFHSLPEKNLVTWNAVISGYAHNGNSRKVSELFERLKETRGLKADEITFLNVLSACWHGRVPVRIAKQYLEMMIVDYMIDPMPEHCSLIVRLMGREGDVTNAEKTINELGFGSCGLVWKTLLGACVDCGNIEVAEVAAKKVMELECDNEFVYVMMSNVYACNEKWEDVGIVRKVMKERKVRKEAGISWL